jgi:hypothetical protein
MTREEFLSLKEGDIVLINDLHSPTHSFAPGQRVIYKNVGSWPEPIDGLFLGTSKYTGHQIIQRLHFSEIIILNE